MNPKVLLTASCAFFFSSLLPAGEGRKTTSTSTTASTKGPVQGSSDAQAPPFDCHRIDAHAPIGVMADHLHGKGEWMLSYRYHRMHMEGQRSGTTDLSPRQVLHQGFQSVALEMDMDMHMVGAMYGLNDDITLLVMTSYLEKQMTLRAGGGHGGHGHASAGHASSPHGGAHHGHSSAGWGDSSVGLLYQLQETNRSRLHLGLQLSLPTGEELERDGHAVLPYGMQLGSGTFDLKPSLTYVAQETGYSYGAQISGVLRLEGENDAGYALGNSVQATAWAAKPLGDDLSLSLRGTFTHQETIHGHYNVPHPHAAPPHFTANYGGDVFELGFGANFRFPGKGLLGGTRLGIEAVLPVHEDLNGIGMSRDWSVILGIQKGF